MGEATGPQLLWSNCLRAGSSCSPLAASAWSWAPTWAVCPHGQVSLLGQVFPAQPRPGAPLQGTGERGREGL